MARRTHFLLLLLAFLSGITLPALAEEPAAKAPAEIDAKKVLEQAAKDREHYELYKLLADTMDEVERNYVKEVDRRELMEAAINGILSKLDPYSSYISPDELSGFRTSIENEFGGVGIQVTLDGGQLKVLSPLVGSPAYRAGIRAGDRITAIDSQATKGFTLSDAVKRLKGKEGTAVKLTVIHPQEAVPQELTLVREVIQVETVLADQRNTDDAWDYLFDDERRIGYIRVSSFSRDTAGHLRAALQTLERERMQGLVLDLRYNPGGLLSSAIEIADLFVTEGVIVSTEGRNAKQRVWNAHEEGTFKDFPMVVLVNRYSASASEIVAACLQDHKRAMVFGERTWGKGSVQNVIELEEGKSALKLTTAGYQRPSGKPIHRFPDAKEWGVSPNDGAEVSLTDEEMSNYLSYRRQRDVVAFHEAPDKGQLEEGAPPEPDASALDEPAAKSDYVDRQLQRALDHLTTEIARADEDSDD